MKTIREHCPEARIVFDLLHAVASLGRVIDTIGTLQHRQANTDMRELIKRSRYPLLSNPQNLKPDDSPRLKELLPQNERLAVVYILKESPNKPWQYNSRKWAENFLHYWSQPVDQSGVAELTKFGKTLQDNSYRILSHCKFPTHTSRLGGINSKTQVTKRTAHGYHDIEYSDSRRFSQLATNSQETAR